MNPILAACVWMIGAIVSFTSMAVAGRAVAIELDTFELMMYRSFIGIGLIVVIGGLTGALREVSTRHMSMHAIRNVSHFAGQNLWFYAITVLPLAQVFALEFTMPLWVLLISPFILHERLTRYRVLAALSGFVGVLIVARPVAGALDPNLLYAAGAAIGFAGSVVYTRKLTRTETTTCVLFWLVIFQAALGVVCAGYDGQIALPTVRVLPWVVVVSCAGLLAHFCLTKALSIAPATVVIPVDFTRLPVIVVVGAVVYSEAVDPMVLLGAAVIFAGNYVNIWHETRKT